jgi:hypothetical protein
LFALDHSEGPRDTPEISLRDRQRSSMRPSVRLTKRSDGGFRVEGVSATPLDAIPDGAGFAVSGAGPWQLNWNDPERGWRLDRVADDSPAEAGRTTSTTPEFVVAPSGVLLADGRLFRLALIGASDPRFELGRWDVPGAYVVGRPVPEGWELERTASGDALDAPPELWILTCVEIGRLDGWFSHPEASAEKAEQQ